MLDELRRAAQSLRGARVLHVNATPYGGGVSELLRSIVPLLEDLGVVADWKIIRGDEAFFNVTKAIHNGLQGAPRALTGDEQATYLANARANAAEFAEEYDFVFVHDPQPAALLPLRGKGGARWIWRCHRRCSGRRRRELRPRDRRARARSRARESARSERPRTRSAAVPDHAPALERSIADGRARLRASVVTHRGLGGPRSGLRDVRCCGYGVRRDLRGRALPLLFAIVPQRVS